MTTLHEAAQPDTRKVIEELLYCVEAWKRGCLHEDYWRDRDDAIQAGQEWLEADCKKPAPAVKLNRRGGARRNKPSTAVMTPDQVREARVLRVEQKKPIKELMAKYSASRSTLRNALYGLGYYEGIL